MPATLPAFVGRRHEWEQLQTAWQQASSGKPRFALLTGEAGIGKSRLAEELLTWAGRQGVAVARTRAYAAEGQLALAPVSDILRSEGIRPHLARLDAVWRTEVVRILPEILTADRHLPRPGPITEYGQRQRFFQALARAVLAAPSPLMILIDDVQWCDQETLAWLHFLLRFDAAARLLVVATARDEELIGEHPVRTFLRQLGEVVPVEEIALGPLDAAETARLAAQMEGRELHASAALRLYRETEGNPLFVVETVRAGLSQALAPLPAAAFSLEGPIADGRSPLPPRVYTVIAGRLAQLSPPAREVVGIAATIGRNFTRDVLLRAGHDDDERLDQTLEELWSKRIVREHGANSYDFTHDKLREVAYREIGVPQRRGLHRRIARAFEALHADDLDPVSSQIAMHYEQAGLAERAIPSYQRAAAVARRVYANDDAIGLLSRGLGLLERLPASLERDRQELSLLLALSAALRVTRGWTAPEVEQALERALALCEQIDDEHRVQVLIGLQTVRTVQARFDDVQRISEQLDALDRPSRDPAPRLLSQSMLSGSCLHRGQLAEAHRGFTEVELIAAADLDQMQRMIEAHGVNYVVQTRAWHAHALWCLGYPEAALTMAQGAIRLARELAQPFSHALAVAYLAILMQLSADTATARTHAEAALAAATESKALYYQAWATILVDSARAWEEPGDERITRLRESIAAFTASGARIRLPYYLSLLARVYGKAGRPADGLAVIDEALAAARGQNEHWWDAELHRLRGDLLLMRGAAAPDGEAAVLSALQIARAQGAKSLELRAAASLVQVRIAQQRPDDGRRLLADLYGWFKEGLETPDLQAARSLLAQPT
jgi:predicted ATPase